MALTTFQKKEMTERNVIISKVNDILLHHENALGEIEAFLEKYKTNTKIGVREVRDAMVGEQ